MYINHFNVLFQLFYLICLYVIGYFICFICLFVCNWIISIFILSLMIQYKFWNGFMYLSYQSVCNLFMFHSNLLENSNIIDDLFNSCFMVTLIKKKKKTLYICVQTRDFQVHFFFLKHNQNCVQNFLPMCLIRVKYFIFKLPTVNFLGLLLCRVN